MRIEKLRQVSIKADDLDKTSDFYEHILGARRVARYDPPGLLFFDLDGTRLLFEQNGTPTTLYFWVDDIDAACEELTSKGVALESPPHMIFKDDAGTFGPAGEGEWMAFFKDPSGNMMAFASRKPG